MGKITVHVEGTIKVKMDTKDDVYYDAKDPHVSLERNGRVILNHLSLDSVDNIVGRDSDEKKAIYWIRDNKDMLKIKYLEYNR